VKYRAETAVTAVLSAVDRNYIFYLQIDGYDFQPNSEIMNK